LLRVPNIQYIAKEDFASVHACWRDFIASPKNEYTAETCSYKFYLTQFIKYLIHFGKPGMDKCVSCEYYKSFPNGTKSPEYIRHRF